MIYTQAITKPRLYMRNEAGTPAFFPRISIHEST